MPLLAALGFAGALFHVLNHAVFKALLFLGAGSVLHATGTAELDELGGLRRHLPVTAATFLVGAAAISALPPFNGFISEWLIYWGALSGVTAQTSLVAVPCGAFLALLAAVGGLALACFAKAFGIVFLGEPRSERTQECHEAPASMRVPMVILAAACLAFGLAGPVLVPALAPVISALTGEKGAASLAGASSVLGSVTLVTGILLLAAGLVAGLRRLVLRRRERRVAGTWDCGYSAPAATMQYTASSFAQPIVELYGAILRTRKRVEPPEIHFPDAAHVTTETPDLSREGIYEPLFQSIERALRRMHIMQHGRVQIYVLGVVLTLLALLLWQVQ
jgi:NADH:ubiquinone oxidoreductase subunit 5 (subunit L)/multisubunit Na+/H+ antiporter MnhA subunit